ncbi:MAG: hypothetical protein ACR2H6_14055 [Pyrinomonadaceae bacterium]
MKTQKLYLLLLLPALTLSAMGAAFTAFAYDDRKFKPGERVEVGGGQSVEIFQCKGEGSNEECEVQFFRDSKPEGGKMWFSANSIRSGEERVKAARDREAAAERYTEGQKTQTVAPTAQPKFQPGEFIETGGGITEEILECRGAGENRECKTQSFRDGAPVGGGNWQSVSDLRRSVNRVQSYKRNEAAVAAPNAANNKAAAVVEQAPQAGAANATCSFDPPGPKPSNADPFSAGLAKRVIYDRYKMYANGTLSAPLRVGVQFVSFQFDKSYTNIVQNVRGVGAQRLNDAAPPNATIYRVKSKHIVCDEYRDGVQRKEVTGDYDCFKNRDGEWVCGSGGTVPPRIIQLQ